MIRQQKLRCPNPIIRHLQAIPNCCMQPSPSLVKHYPLAIGLAVLLLPYIYKLLILPFTFRSYFAHPTPSVSNSTGKVVLTTTSSIIQSSSISTSTTTVAGGFNLWRGVLEVIGPKAEDKQDKSVKTTHSTTPKSKATSTSTVTSVKVTTIKDVKTVTKSVTKSFTKSITETVQITLQNPIEEPENRRKCRYRGN